MAVVNWHDRPLDLPLPSLAARLNPPGREYTSHVTRGHIPRSSGCCTTTDAADTGTAGVQIPAIPRLSMPLTEGSKDLLARNRDQHQHGNQTLQCPNGVGLTIYGQ